MRRALAKYRTRELKLNAIAGHLRGVFSQSEAAVAMPNPSSGLCWPLLPPAFLPENASLVTSIIVSLYTLCLHGQRTEKLAADHDPSIYPIAAASIFPEAAGDLPSWKQLLSPMFKAMSETPDLRPTSRDSSSDDTPGELPRRVAQGFSRYTPRLSNQQVSSSVICPVTFSSTTNRPTPSGTVTTPNACCRLCTASRFEVDTAHLTRSASTIAKPQTRGGRLT